MTGFEPLGRWKTEGRLFDDSTPITGWDTHELLPGECFVVHHVNVRAGFQRVHAIAVIGERDVDEDSFVGARL